MDKLLFSILYSLADGKRIRLEVTGEVMELLQQSDRQIRSQRRQDRRRLMEYIDGVTDTTAILPSEDFADLVIRMDSYRRLYAAVEKLSVIQRRRVRLYYFRWFTCRQIADMEKVSVNAVAQSLARAIDNLKRVLAP